MRHPPGSYTDVVMRGPQFGPGDTIVGVRDTASALAEAVELDAGIGDQRRVLIVSRTGAGRALALRDVPVRRRDPDSGMAGDTGRPRAVPTIVEAHGGPHATTDETYDAGAQCWVDRPP